MQEIRYTSDYSMIILEKSLPYITVIQLLSVTNLTGIAAGIRLKAANSQWSKVEHNTIKTHRRLLLYRGI